MINKNKPHIIWICGFFVLYLYCLIKKRIIMETCIVLISVDFVNARKVCNFIENQKFDSRESARTAINELLGEDEGHVSIFHLTDFMEEVNDQYLDNLTEHFISYIKIGE